MSLAQVRSSTRSAAVLATLLLLAAAPGCQSGGGKLGRGGPNQVDLDQTEAMQNRLMSRWIGSSTPENDPNNADRSILRRPLSGLVLGPDGWDPRGSGVDESEIATEFRDAEELYLKGELSSAERAFARIARKHRKPGGIKIFNTPDLSTPLDGDRTPWGMKALYYLAEIKFQRGNYMGAHDTYEQLLKTYPGTNYLDKAVAREYEIAQIWLNQTTSDPDREPLPWTARFRGGLPIIDTGGHALAALEHVRQNDPTGPLADQAAKEIADYHYQVGDYETAAIYYDQLISDHPKSPLLHQALLASIDSKVKAYIGPEYDGSGLQEARETVLRTQALFPERLTSTSDALYKTLDLIADQDAERDYATGRYYQRAGHVISAEHYFGKIIHKWPKSPWADKAREQLAELAKKPRRESLPSRMMVQPGAGDPYERGMTGGNPNMLGPGFGGP